MTTMVNRRIEEGLPKAVKADIPPTAFEGYELVAPVAMQWSKDSFLWKVSSAPHADADRSTLGPCVGTDGRIKEHGLWVYQFLSDAEGRQLVISLAASGDIKTESTRWIKTDPPKSALEPGWADSGKVMAIAESEAGAAFTSDKGPMLDTILELDSERQLWVVYYMSAGPESHRLYLYIDPMSLRVVETDTQ